MNKAFYFLGGLPRAGSTLISSILSQNPKIYASPNSPVCGNMLNIEMHTIASEQYRAYPKPSVIPTLTKGILDNFYSDVEKEIVIDKCRDWPCPEPFEMLKRNLTYDPKIIVAVRDITDILASFISLLKKNVGKANFIDGAIQNNKIFHLYRPIDDIRCDHLMLPGGLIDNALFGVFNATRPENKKYFHLVEYEDLVANPEKEINKIYDFLGLDHFKHDYENIENTTPEDDNAYGLIGQHDVRSSIGKRKIDKNKVLSDYIIKKYSDMEFWRDKDHKNDTSC